MDHGKQNSKNINDSIRQLLSENLESLSDDEILEECIEDYGTIEKMTSIFNEIFSKANKTASNQKMITTNQNDIQKTNVFDLSLDTKRALLQEISISLSGKLTMAARNAEGTGDDIDRKLEDLIELNVIDQEGNIL